MTGESELVIAKSAAGPGDYVLDVWSPAVLSATASAGPGAATGELPVQLFAEPADQGRADQSIKAGPVLNVLLGARDTGMQSISVDQYPRQSVRLVWELQAQKRVRGRSMHLALPGEATTVLELELPKDWVPLVRVGRRRGPLDGGRADRINWEIEAESGRIELDVFNPDQKDLPAQSDLWVSGTTQIDLRGATDRSLPRANCSTDWLVELDPRNPKTLEAELDPGLELIEVVGPAVRGYRIEPESGGRRVSVALGGALQSMTEVRFLADARVPSEGMWSIPAIKPLNAAWTGGTTTVFLDPRHVVARCTEKAGRRIVSPGGETAQTKKLVFQAGSPRSVADLVFRGSPIESSCLVRGQLFISESPARLECQLDWSAPDALALELEIELSPGWITERVLMRGATDPLVWHASPLELGSTKLQVAIPASTQRKEISLTYSASSSSPGFRGPLELPRVIPLGARIVDEAWLAWADQTTMIRPTDARGLAWIDPAGVAGLQPARQENASLREALAWRWMGQSGRGRVVREPIEQEPSASIVMNAIVDPAKGHVTLDGRLSVLAGAEAVEGIPIWIEGPAGSAESLHFEDRGGGTVARRPLEQSARAAPGFPDIGQAFDLAMKIAAQNEKTVYFHAEYPWASGSVVPALAVSRKYLQRGVVVVKTPQAVRSRFKAAGLRVLDASAGLVEKRDGVTQPDGPGREGRETYGPLDVHAFVFNEPGARLELVTEALEAMPEQGVVREALLATSIDPNGATVHRLRLFLHCGKARSLDLAMPGSTSLVRVRRDGTDVVPIETGTDVSIPLPEAGQGAKFCTIVLDYVERGEMRLTSGRVRPVLPVLTFPCLSFTWELVSSGGYEAVDCGPGLFAVGNEPSVGTTLGGLEMWRRAWELLPGAAGSRGSDEAIRSLDDRLGESGGDELTFAEWFARWDAGPRAVIVDRLSLYRAGFGSEVGMHS